ncbi:hypothetical protein L1987_06410 [Smallanthus sonchifolius]|uniref:Uncharacterized protein n=1 Tax=Smallanthus sonchifolius TaxID=185202 RepID=A0ACB9JY31_9ASTR|nr:hypothetical protein L1987_06410 [Smallanthus sonchifolius]
MYPGRRAARAPDPICNGWPPLHQLLLSDAESGLPCSDGEEALSEYWEGYLYLGIQTNPRSDLASRHVLQGPSEAKLNGRDCRHVTAVQPERREELQGELDIRLPQDVQELPPAWRQQLLQPLANSQLAQKRSIVRLTCSGALTIRASLSCSGGTWCEAEQLLGVQWWWRRCIRLVLSSGIISQGVSIL